MLTHEEKWFFDLQGYLILPQAVPPEEVSRMVELCDQWHALPDSELPPPLRSYADPDVKPTTARAINNVEYADEVFQRLVLNPQIMRVVLALTGNCPQLLDVALTRNTVHSDDIPLHGGFGGGLRNPANDYQAADGQILATFLNAGVSLVDVPPGTGFVCVPGSHKSNFAMPPSVTIHSEPPILHNVSVRAGDVILFTEALCHGGRAWTQPYARRTAFVRYCTSYASWTPTHEPIEAHRDKLSEAVYELHKKAGFQERKHVVECLLAEMCEL